jgi:LPXTG-motif cell wall-anchored protein
VTRRFLTALAASAALIISAGAPAHAAEPALENGASWLESQLVNDALPGPFSPVDWGLTIDGLLALRAAQLKPAVAGKIADAVAANVDSYATGVDWGGPEEIEGGATAKILFAAVAAGRDPLDFGGHNMRQRTLALVDPANGWLMDSSSGALVNGGNMFDQSLAVLGLAGSGGVPENVVAFLLKQQCDDGGFRIQLSADEASACVSDVDATAMAVQALYVAGGTAAASDAVDWLIGVQGDDGGLTADGSAGPGNTNSTGLAGQAFYAAGKQPEAEQAAIFIRSNQLTTANGGASAAHAGAIAWDKAVLAGAQGTVIGEFEFDQWRRATAQALLGLSKVPMGRIGIDGPPPYQPSASPSPSASVPGGGNLPVTGASTMTYALAGGGVLLAGVVLLLVARRRKETAR